MNQTAGSFPIVESTCYCGGNGAAQGCHCCHGNLLVAEFGGAGVTSCHHVGFQKSSLQIDMMVRQGLVAGSKDLEIHGK